MCCNVFRVCACFLCACFVCVRVSCVCVSCVSCVFVFVSCVPEVPDHGVEAQVLCFVYACTRTCLCLNMVCCLFPCVGVYSRLGPNAPKGPNHVIEA